MCDPEENNEPAGRPQDDNCEKPDPEQGVGSESEESRSEVEPVAHHEASESSNGTAESEHDGQQDIFHHPTPPETIPEARPPDFRFGRTAYAALRLIYRHNPFYLLSAFLVLYGLNAIFQTDSEDANCWVLLGVLLGYTLLTAFTAVLIVRIGKVWEDARWLFLVTVLLFLAVSVSFDEIVARRPATGIPVLLVGYVVSVCLSEFVLRGCRIKMRALFRVPYYALLSLFILYPILPGIVVQLTDSGNRGPLNWSLLGFPATASLLLFLLLPAIRRGREYVAENGTPWKWPWFPWALFAPLSLCVCLRTYWLSLSFYPGTELESPFGVYFLLPFLLSVSVLALEFARVSRVHWLRPVALIAPAITLFMCFPGDSPNPFHAECLETVTTQLASPVLLGVLGAAVFYLYAWIRGERWAEMGFVLTLVFASVIGRQTLNVNTYCNPQAWPFLVIGLTHAWLAWRTRSSLRASLSLVHVVFAMGVQFDGTWVMRASGALPLNILLIGLMLIGASFADRFAGLLRHATAFLVCDAFLVAVFGAEYFAPSIPVWAVSAYALLLIALGFAYWLIVGCRSHLYALLLNLAALCIKFGVGMQGYLGRPERPRGLSTVVWGLVAFLIATLISLAKGGILRRFIHPLSRLKARAEGEV